MQKLNSTLFKGLAWATHSDCAAFGVSPDNAAWCRAWVRNQLQRLPDLQAKVLVDLGADPGNSLTHWYCRRARHSFLIDLYHPPTPLAHATALAHDLNEPLPFADSTIDVVVSCNTLQFLPALGRANLLKQVQRILRPGGVALLSMSYLWPLNPQSLAVMNDEPFLVQNKIKYFGPLEMDTALRSASSLTIEGDFEESELPGNQQFSTERLLATPDLLINGITDFNPSAFRPSMIDLKLRRASLALRLRKAGANPPRKFNPRPMPAMDLKHLELLAGQRGPLAGVKMLLVNQPAGEFLDEIIRRGATAQITDEQTAPEITSPYDLAVVNQLHQLENPEALLDAAAKTARELWITATLVDSDRPECTAIPPDDIAEAPVLAGCLRISKSWLWRQLLRAGHQPIIVNQSAASSVPGPQQLLIRTVSINHLPPDSCRPLLVHVHLPKNAGSSFNDFLARSAGPGFVPLYHDDPAQLFDEHSFCEAILRHPTATAISSHSIVAYDPVTGFRRALYIAFLRRPIDRYLSYYRFARAHSREFSQAHRDLLPPGLDTMSPQDYLNFEATLAQSGLLSHSQCALLNRGIDDADAAIANLKSFFFVGIVEQMDRSIELLRRKCASIGITLADWHGDRLNTTTHPPDQTAHLSPASNHPFLAADEKLYAWGVNQLHNDA